MSPGRKVHPLVKAAVVVLLLGGLGLLFVRTAQDSRAEPYQVNARWLNGWTLGLDTAADADGALVSLRPPAELPMNLFRQLFARQMESMGAPSVPGIALALRREVPGEVSGAEVLALARDAGLGQAAVTPVCVGYRRTSNLGATRQLYFVWFEVPGFARFRQALAPHAGPAFDPAALSPVLLMAAQPNFIGWHPVVVDRERDCVAPVTVD